MRRGDSYFVGAALFFALAATALFPGAAAADDGHCEFTYYVSSVKASFKACQMPADTKMCESLAEKGDKTRMKHEAGSCRSEGARGMCDFGDRQLVFYTGNVTDHAIGCSYMKGIWRDPPKYEPTAK